jgi:hypothetical protein
MIKAVAEKSMMKNEKKETKVTQFTLFAAIILQ